MNVHTLSDYITQSLEGKLNTQELKEALKITKNNENSGLGEFTVQFFKLYGKI